MVKVKNVSANFQGILLQRLNLSCVWSKLNMICIKSFLIECAVDFITIL